MRRFKERSNWTLRSDDASFQWESFLNVAEECCGRSEEEWLRTGVGRAYYACFLVARDYERSANDDDRPKEAHKEWWFFQENCGRVGKQIYSLAARMKRTRGKADYEQKSLNWAKELERSIADSKTIIELVIGLGLKKGKA